MAENEPGDAGPVGTVGDGALGDGTVGDGTAIDGAVDGGEEQAQREGGWVVPKDVRPPRLTHAPIDLSGSYDAATGRLGDLRCDRPMDRPVDAERGCFGGFSASGGGWISLVTTELASVFATASGVVSEVTQDTVTVRLNQASAYWLEYSGLTDILVAVDQQVAAGDVLGHAAQHHSAGFGAVSFAVRHHEHLLQRICPERYGDDAFVAELSAARDANNESWPEHPVPSACASGAVLCEGPACTAGQVTPALGDVDLGRLIYRSSCAVCHGDQAEGIAAPDLLTCTYCGSPKAMADRTTIDMPPGGTCDRLCAADVSAFVFFEFH
ncbi:MAG: peptidoglycan DD-metalloendopeptidase family protein [Myxococcales bacterium]|nr:peptidoglycan DD-metalloendopeptidase family protein [Myxococcales bacterium]